MLRHGLIACLLAAVSAGPALAQNGPLPFAARADIAAARARAAASRQPGHGTASAPLATLSGYKAKVEFHVGPNNANVHPHEDELFQALEGSGTIVTGGQLVGTGAGATISGGTAHAVAAGDVFVVPAGTPHWYSQVKGHLVMISIMLPHEPAAPAP
jgi:mannose-6-phosphate isomerase-like protein (cupin superfamily)